MNIVLSFVGIATLLLLLILVAAAVLKMILLMFGRGNRTNMDS